MVDEKFDPQKYLPTPVQKLLLKAILTSGDTAMEAWTSWNLAIDFNDIDYDSCCLVPALYESLKAQEISTPFMFTMKGIYRKIWYKNQLLFNHLEFILKKLEQENIFTLVFKGTALVPRYYQDYGKRPVEELELLVPQEQKDLIVTVLQEIGWSIGFKGEKKQPWRFIQQKDKVKLDIHWAALQEPMEALDQCFWQGCESLQLKNLSGKILCPADQLLHVLIDGVHSHRVSPLRWVMDASMILKQTPQLDWSRFLDHKNRFHLSDPVDNMLPYLKDTFGAPIPEKVLN